MEDFAAGDHKEGDKLISATKPLFEAAVAGCDKDLLDKMYAIHNRYDALKARSDWPSISMDIYMKNKDVLQRDEILSVKEWTEGVFFNSGMYVGQVEKIFLDNAPQSWRTFMSDTTRDPTAPAQYMAGWFYGVS